MKKIEIKPSRMITGKSEELSNYGFKQRIPINHKISTVDTF